MWWVKEYLSRWRLLWCVIGYYFKKHQTKYLAYAHPSGFPLLQPTKHTKLSCIATPSTATVQPGDIVPTTILRPVYVNANPVFLSGWQYYGSLLNTSSSTRATLSWLFASGMWWSSQYSIHRLLQWNRYSPSRSHVNLIDKITRKRLSFTCCDIWAGCPR